MKIDERHQAGRAGCAFMWTNQAPAIFSLLARISAVHAYSNMSPMHQVLICLPDALLSVSLACTLICANTAHPFHEKTCFPLILSLAQALFFALLSAMACPHHTCPATVLSPIFLPRPTLDSPTSNLPTSFSSAVLDLLVDRVQ